MGCLTKRVIQDLGFRVGFFNVLGGFRLVCAPVSCCSLGRYEVASYLLLNTETQVLEILARLGFPQCTTRNKDCVALS